MKKVLYLVVLLISVSATAATPPEISEKVIKAFKETFAGAEDVSWREMENSCQASFKVSEITVRAIYDNEGSLLKTIRYYGEKNLPSNILAKLKKKHVGKEIFGVTEIVTDSEMVFYIVLKDEKNWYWINSDPYGNMVQEQKLKRGEPREAFGF
jgi:hypothetical protein